ncbi:MAG TPA: hypothetical protein VH230_18300 [Stellaceae bacterium]|jgi:mRNA interferase RelE/StbE|nr:hypothetical protein [Stellaceae bacterium]
MTSSARARIEGGCRDRRQRSASLSATSVVDSVIAEDDSAGIKLIVSSAAAKALAGVPRRDREALLDKAEAFAAAPYAVHPSATPLRRRRDLARLRQGDWRAIWRVDRAADTIVLETVAHRREVYR